VGLVLVKTCCPRPQNQPWAESDKVVNVNVNCSSWIDWNVNDEFTVVPEGNIVGKNFFGGDMLLGLVHKESHGVPFVAEKDHIY
jgi:hypothetical protein